ncbi:MAG: hypothetical protein ABI645_05400 [Pseudomonadota bacterium]
MRALTADGQPWAYAAVEVVFMSSKYYAHFVAEASGPVGPAEYSGVVELRAPLQPQRELKDLRRMLAHNFDLPAEDIRVLNWATLH